MKVSHRAVFAFAFVAAGIALAQAQNPPAVSRDSNTQALEALPPAPLGARLKGLPDPYQLEDNWVKMPPGRLLGGVAGITIDRDGKSVWMFERCGTRSAGCALPENNKLNPIMEFDTNGNLVKQFGAGMGFKYPHGIFVDRNGNVWVADGIANPEGGRARGPVGSAGAPANRTPDPKNIGDTVREFTPDGKLLMTLGKEGVAGSGPYEFNGVSDVLVGPNGDIFVADGHGGQVNDRIIKYDSHGKFLLAWGKYGTGPADFNPPHGLAMDKEGNIYVADRSNKVVQVFDQNGKLLHAWKQFGAPSGVFVDKNDTLYVADATSTEDAKSNWYNPGFSPGIRVASVKDGKITANIPWQQYDAVEGVAVDDAGTVYGGYTNIPGSHRWFKKN